MYAIDSANTARQSQKLDNKMRLIVVRDKFLL